VLTIAVALASPPAPVVVLDVVPEPMEAGGTIGGAAFLSRRDRVPVDATCACDTPQLTCEVGAPSRLDVALSISDSNDVPTDHGYLGSCTASDTTVDVEVRLVASVPDPWWQGTTLVFPSIPSTSLYAMKRVRLPAELRDEELHGSLDTEAWTRAPMATGCYLPEDNASVVMVHLAPGEHGDVDCLEGPDHRYTLKVVDIDRVGM